MAARERRRRVLETELADLTRSQPPPPPPAGSAAAWPGMTPQQREAMISFAGDGGGGGGGGYGAGAGV